MEIDAIKVYDTPNGNSSALNRRNNSNYDHSNHTPPDLYCSNVAAMLASVKNFEDTYLDILEEICVNNGANITENVLSSDMLRTLALDYESDAYLASMKFNIF